LGPGAVVAMRGPLAAGKTTMTKGIAKALGIAEDVTSPTFTLISEYAGSMPLYHMDVYRIDGVDEFENLGVDELLSGEGVCVIEWSEKVAKALPRDSITVSITNRGDGSREIEIEGLEALAE
jgi:tRNA threonylcarbamoyladenosine biosynthesis protein TsaE